MTTIRTAYNHSLTLLSSELSLDLLLMRSDRLLRNGWTSVS